VCLRAVATCVRIADDAARVGSADAGRLASACERWLTTEDCAQAASDAAPITMAQSRSGFRARANAIAGATPRALRLTSTYEMTASSRDMLHPQLAPQPKPKIQHPHGRIQSGRNGGGTRSDGPQATRFPLGCGGCATQPGRFTRTCDPGASRARNWAPAPSAPGLVPETPQPLHPLALLWSNRTGVVGPGSGVDTELKLPAAHLRLTLD